MSRDTVTQQEKPSLYNWLGGGVRRFVRWWRRFDAGLNRPLPAGRARLSTLLAPDGYPWFVSVLAGILIIAMALGPTFATGPINLLFLAIGFVLLLALHIAAAKRVWVGQYLLAGQLSILAILLVLLILRSRPEAYGAVTSAPRLHVGAAVVAALIIALSAVWLITRTLFRSDAGGALAQSLPKVELFLPKDRYDFMGRGPVAALASAFAIAPIRYPVEILLPGSLLSLFVPDHYLSYVFYLVGFATWVAVFLGILFDRLMEILQTIGRLFFIGPQRVISILVVVVAILRLLDVHYITYLFNAGSKGFGNTTIMGYIALAYVVAWYYAFWCDNFVARRLIRLLDSDKTSVSPVKISYDFSGSSTLSTVENLGRTIALHGAGRLKVEGVYRGSKETHGESRRAIQFMTPAEVLAQFRAQLERLPADLAPAGDLLASLRNLQRSTIIYPVIVGTLAFSLIGVPAYITFNRAIQPPELDVRSAEHVDKSLASLLFGPGSANKECSELSATAPRIAVVASGGGTRAAMYTASVLHGLAEHNMICNVVVVSGVSGGSAALAYFALHEKELRHAGAMDPVAWDRFSRAMALPYIEYAIDGASDMRIVFGRDHWAASTCDESQKPEGHVRGWMPARSRLGSILAESFVCEMGAATMATPSFGIMLNTAIVGSFKGLDLPCDADKTLLLAERATNCREDLDAAQAGGRLVLTNLSAPVPPPDDGSHQMQMITINNKDVSVARAAALSANFPPVFPDAAIDVQLPHEGKRYWVTDGGAVENRGAMTLYYAIRDAFRSAPDNQQQLPPLYIVVADVSASASRYSESFGFGSVLGAGGQLSLGLETELRAAIGKLYCDHRSQFSAHEITMPAMFTNGGIGTHWLLPNSLSLANPANPSDSRVLAAADIEKLVLALHSKDQPVYDDDAARTVSEWAHDPKRSNHDANWRALLNALSSNQAMPSSICPGAKK